jgi:alkanesulfonate monooxygenase SsuD/methylene tetrahydromethanopterin reductase-like flavin-dependent oxidoreductase (luciferase family)
VLLPRPTDRVPLMIGSNGDRMLSIAIPHVDWWNTWYAGYGNTVEGFEALNARITVAAARAGRDPDEVRRSAAVLVELEQGAVRRPRSDEGITPVAPDDLPAHLSGLEAAGVDEAILILRPITEASIRALAARLPERP